MVCGAISGNRPSALCGARHMRSTVEGVRLGLRPTSRQTQGGRQRDPDVQPADAPTVGLPRFGMHRGATAGGKAFAIVTVLPVLMIMAWLLTGLPLLLANRFFPVPMVLISVPVAVGLVLMASRQLPGRWPKPALRRGAGSTARTTGWSAWWGLAGTVAVAAAFGAWQLRANSPQLIVDRAPGAFFHFGYWIAQHGSLPIPTQLAAFGGSHPGLTFSSFGFISHAGAVAPGLAAGLPITLAAGLWTHGLAGGVALSPLLGALAVLSVGGLTGLLAGIGLGLVGGFALAPPMMEALSPEIGLVALAAAAFLAVTLVGAAAGLVEPVRRRVARVLAARPLRWLPEAGAVIVVAAAAAFVIRPYLQTVEGVANPYIVALQRISHLAANPRRLYAEDSLYWVIWYLGAPALVLGVAGLALLTRRCLRALITWRDPTGSARAWALPLMIIGWGAITVLWRPSTTPDQPWASRQLVPVLIPGLIVAAIWVCAVLALRARERGAGMVAVSAAVACFVAALAVPPVITTFGIGGKRVVSPASYPASSAPAFQRTGVGQLDAITSLCGAIPGGSPVLLLDGVAARRFTQVIRGMCGIPAGVMAGAAPAQVAEVMRQIMRTGHQAVLLATRPAELTPYGGTPSQVVDLTTIQDAHVLIQPPASGWPVRYVLWMSGPGTAGGPGGGA